MSDVTEAPNQDAIAESLLGEPEQQVAEQPEAEQQVEEQVQEQPIEQQQEQVEEAAEDWLPTEQDKVFPDEVIARYAERMGVKAELLQEPTVRQLLVNKLNTDIFLEQQRQAAEQQQFEEPAAAEQQEATQPQVTQEQHFQNLAMAVRQRTSPEVAKAFHNEFLSIWQLPEAQQPQALAEVTSKYMLNLVNTFLPDMLQAQLAQQLGQAFPGFGDMYDRSSHAMAWDRVRNSDARFANLPAYGTKQFSTTLRAAAARIPGFDDMQFTDQQGRPLAPQQNAERKYAMLAQIASGHNVNPQLLQQAAAAGARNARRADVRRAAGNLGSGQARGGAEQSTSSRFQTNTDIFDDETVDRLNGRL